MLTKVAKKPYSFPDPYYKYEGGFVGNPGDMYHVRFNTQSRCKIRHEKTGVETEIFLGSPCRAEYTIANRNLFQVPSFEYRMAFSKNNQIKISHRPSEEKEPLAVSKLQSDRVEYSFKVRTHENSVELKEGQDVIDATLSGDLLNAESTYYDENMDFTVTVEFPVNLINLNEEGNQFQVCTGPILVPDLSSWDGSDIRQCFLAHVAFTSFDHVEFILRREVDVSENEKRWISEPRGIDRNELLDPGNRPPNYPPRRWQATTYNEIWEFAARNVFYKSTN